MKKITLSTLQAYKANGEKFSCLTAYDASFARLFDEAGIDLLLVGDSLGNVIQGHDSTVPVTVDDIVYHTQCVTRATEQTFVVADMPFMSMPSREAALRNAGRLMQAGASMVKIEGKAWLADYISEMVQQGIPVCAHMGLTPQSVNVFGGFKVQGRNDDAAAQLLADAQTLADAGAQLLVLECVPAPLAKQVTEAVSIPVIGIGAGRDTDGQILVMQDVLGISHGIVPKFSKDFLKETGDIRLAIATYIKQVKNLQFPADEHIFNR